MLEENSQRPSNKQLPISRVHLNGLVHDRHTYIPFSVSYLYYHQQNFQENQYIFNHLIYLKKLINIFFPFRKTMFLMVNKLCFMVKNYITTLYFKKSIELYLQQCHPNTKPFSILYIIAFQSTMSKYENFIKTQCINKK